MIYLYNYIHFLMISPGTVYSTMIRDRNEDFHRGHEPLRARANPQRLELDQGETQRDLREIAPGALKFATWGKNWRNIYSTHPYIYMYTYVIYVYIYIHIYIYT